MVTLIPALLFAAWSSPAIAYEVTGSKSADTSPFLDSYKPFVTIGHRGSCGHYPEHTTLAYHKAIEEGAAFIECDICLTKDHALICRHEPLLDETTDVTERPEFADRKTTRLLDGKLVVGFYSVDFTLAEIKSLRAVQRLPFRDQSYNGRELILTFDEYLTIALQAGRTVGVYPEIKHPSFFNEFLEGEARIEDMVLEAFQRRGFSLSDSLSSPGWQRRPVVIQSFEADALRYIKERASVPLMMLLPAVNETDPAAALQLSSPEGVSQVREFAQIIGPDKTKLMRYSDGARTSTGLVEAAKRAGLIVHLYTLRDEAQFFEYGGFRSIQEELQYFIQLGVTGGFADFPKTAVDYARSLRGADLEL